VTEDVSAKGETAGLKSWSELSAVEQSLMRGGLRKRRTTGTIQAHGMVLRWTGAQAAPLIRGYTSAEQHELIPEFADAAANLVAQDLLEVRAMSGDHLREDADPAVPREDLDRVLYELATWIWNAEQQSSHWLDASQAAHRDWYQPAYFSTACSDRLAYRELNELQRAIIVSAMEASGMLTGPFGIWDQPEPELTPAARSAVVDEMLAPLLPFVRDGLLEVQFRSDARSDAYTVIPLDELRTAFTGAEIWRDREEADFFEGAHAVFTLAGYATWHTPPASR
jgi:hypothetical protein